MTGTVRRAFSISQSIASRVLGGALQFGSNIVLARLLGAADLGLYHVFDAWHKLVAVVAGLGLPTATTRTVAEAWTRDRRALGRAALRLAIGVGGAVGLAGIVVLGLLERGSGLVPTIGSGPIPGPAWIGLAAGLLLLARIASQALKALRLSVVANVLEFSVVPTGVLVVALTHAGVRGPPPLTLVIGAHVGLLCVVAGAALALAARRLRGGGGSAPADGTLRDRFAPRRLVPYWSTMMLHVAGASLPIMLLPAFASPEDVGRFSIGMRLVSVGGVALSGLASYVTPRFAPSGDPQDERNAFRWLYASQAIGVVVFAPLFAVLWFVPDVVLALFGAEFAAAEGLVRILVFGQLANAAFGLVGPLASMTGREMLVVLSHATSLAAFLVLAFTLGSSLGATGFAVAVTASLVLRNAVLWIACHLVRAAPLSSETVEP